MIADANIAKQVIPDELEFQINTAKASAQEDWGDRKVQKPFRVAYETRNAQYVK